MRKIVAQANCIALPFATALAGSVITPGYFLAGHATTLSIATIVAFAALFAITLNMRQEPDAQLGLPIAAGWLVASSVFIATMMETVILRPGGIGERHWMPSMVLLAISIITLCEVEGRRMSWNMLQRASSQAMLALGGVLLSSLIISAAARRLSGDDSASLGITLLFAPLVLGAMIQIARGGNPSRARLGAASLLMLFMVIVTAEGTYTWSPHYDSDLMSRRIFG